MQNNRCAACAAAASLRFRRFQRALLPLAAAAALLFAPAGRRFGLGRGGRVARLERRRGQRPYRLLRVRGHGGGETDDSVRRAERHDRRVQPPLGRRGHPHPRRGRADPEALRGGARKRLEGMDLLPESSRFGFPDEGAFQISNRLNSCRFHPPLTGAFQRTRGACGVPITHEPQPDPAATRGRGYPSWERALPARQSGATSRVRGRGCPQSQEDRDLGKPTGSG